MMVSTDIRDAFDEIHHQNKVNVVEMCLGTTKARPSERMSAVTPRMGTWKLLSESGT